MSRSQFFLMLYNVNGLHYTHFTSESYQRLDMIFLNMTLSVLSKTFRLSQSYHSSNEGKYWSSRRKYLSFRKRCLAYSLAGRVTYSGKTTWPSCSQLMASLMKR